MSFKTNKLIYSLYAQTQAIPFFFDFQVYWHSSAHIMGEAMERVYGGCLCYGPPIENGFYYDMYLEEG